MATLSPPKDQKQRRQWIKKVLDGRSPCDMPILDELVAKQLTVPVADIRSVAARSNTLTSAAAVAWETASGAQW